MPEPARRRPQRPAAPAAGDPARSVALAALRLVGTEDAYANLVLPRLLRERHIRGRDAALATEITYGVLRMQALYDAILAEVSDRPLSALDADVRDALRVGVHQLVGMRTPAHAAVSATVGALRAAAGAGAAGFVNAVLRRVAEVDADTWTDLIAPAPQPGAADEDDALAVRFSHPAWMVRALRQALRAHGRPASEITDLLAADNAAPAVTLLVRPGLPGSEQARRAVQDAAAVPGRWSPHAWLLDHGSPGDLAVIRDGRVRVADEGSQVAALALLVPGLSPAGGGPERWLDLCAGPGGKSALLSGEAAARRASGVSVELRPQRADLVRVAVTGAERWWQVRTDDGRDVGAAEPGGYDRVLVDVPCTGLGALRRRPESRWRRRPSDLPQLAPVQRALLVSALAACRPGGVVAYVTCSPHIAETIAVVEDVLRAGSRGSAPRAVRLDARDSVRDAAGRPMEGTGAGPDAQLWPHVHGTDAMFVALLRRVADPA